MAEEPVGGIKISDGDWKSLNNRLDELDQTNKDVNKSLTSQETKIKDEVEKSKTLVQTIINIYGELDSTTTLIPYDDTIPQSSEGKKFMEVSITPKNEKNTLIIDGSVSMSTSATGTVAMAIFQDAGVSAIGMGIQAVSYGLMYSGSFFHKMVAGSVKPIVFKLHCGNSVAGTFYFNGEGGARKYGTTIKSFMRVTEISESAISVT